MVGPYAADAVPGVLVVREFAFTFVALEESWDEEFVGHGVEFDAAGLAVFDDFCVVIEVDDFDDSAGLGCVVGNFVVISRIEGFAAGEPHQGVTVGGCDVDIGPEQFFAGESVPLLGEFRSATEDSFDAGFFNAAAFVHQSQSECFEEFGCGEHALDVIIGGEHGESLVNAVCAVFLCVFDFALFEEFDDPAGVEVYAEADTAAELCEVFDCEPQSPGA